MATRAVRGDRVDVAAGRRGEKGAGVCLRIRIMIGRVVRYVLVRGPMEVECVDIVWYCVRWGKRRRSYGVLVDGR